MSRRKTVLLALFTILTVGFAGCSRPKDTVWKLTANQDSAMGQPGKADQ